MDNPNRIGRLFTRLVLAGLFALPSAARAATITCDQEDGDYAPWETVWLTGAGFEPHSDITLAITWPDGSGDDVFWGFFDEVGVGTWVSPTCPPEMFNATADDAGGFLLTYYKTKVEGAFPVKATDEAGNEATTTFTDSVTSVTITSVSPTGTFASLPADVTVSFDYVTSSTGTTTATLNILGTSISGTKSLTPGSGSDSMTVEIPTGTANGTYNVKVTVNNSTGSGANSKNDVKNGALVINVPAGPAAPTVTSVSPDWGGQGTTQSVTIAGTNFTGTTIVSFGAGIGVTFTVDTATQISATLVISPTAAAGVRVVSVTTTGGTGAKADGFTVVADTTGPVSSASLEGTAGNNGWHRSAVTVTLTATDNAGGSGVAGISYQLDGGPVQSYSAPFTVETEGQHSLCCWAQDCSGNCESPHDLAINIDWTPPAISGSASPEANANGWNNSDVTVSYVVSESGSGIDTATSDLGDDLLSSEGTNLSASGTAVDLAGNSASATVAGINIDKTAPVLGVPPTAGPFILGSGSHSIGPISVNADISGLDDDLSTLTVSVDAATVGSRSVTFTAVDHAGNTATTTASYGVIYGYAGLQPPYDRSKPFKAGSTIPLKWCYTDSSGATVDSPSASPTVQINFYSSQAVEGEAITPTDSGQSGYQYDNLTGIWQYNWQTKKLSAGTYRIRIFCSESQQTDGPFEITLK
jgi:hypothetical protein